MVGNILYRSVAGGTPKPPKKRGLRARSLPRRRLGSAFALRQAEGTMAVRFAFFVAVVGALVIAAAGATAAEPNLAAYGRLPLQFEPSSDEQAAPGEFVARGPGYSVRLTPAAATTRFRHSPQVVRMRLENANPPPHGVGLDRLPGTVSYL